MARQGPGGARLIMPFRLLDGLRKAALTQQEGLRMGACVCVLFGVNTRRPAGMRGHLYNGKIVCAVPRSLVCGRKLTLLSELCV